MFFERQDRKIIPRWRDFLTTAALGELNSTWPKAASQPWPDSTLGETRTAWTEHRTLWHALDFVGSAFSLGIADKDTREAAQYIISSHANSAPKAGLVLAARTLSGTEETPPVPEPQGDSNEAKHAEIRQKRSQTISDPRNAITWVDLARLYTVVGQIPQAERAIEIALKLSPTNRFVLRSATRFFVHVGNRDRALRLLRMSEIVDDPWIVAAEIGVSTLEQRHPTNVKAGRRILENTALSSFTKTELASALATLELQDGRNGPAKRLFRQSLEDPNENSLAQAEWASTQIPQLEVDAERPVIRSYEAKALLGLKTGDWDLAAKNSLDWLHDQPFSSRPAATASYIFSAIYDEQERAEDILKTSLISNHRDRALTNNLAFALANQDKIAEAEKVLATVHPEDADDGSRVTLLATNGLVMFRKGVLQEGRMLYLKAMNLAKQKGLTKFEALASIYLAREEILAKQPEAIEDLKRAGELASKSGEPDVVLVLEKVSRMATASE
jgi:tetratricopeptide (TPR) repeat protein